jgi:hypothetical protein
MILSLSNIKYFFDECGASIDGFLPKNEDYQIDDIIVKTSMGYPLHYIFLFINPQTKDSVLTYITDLIEFVDECTKKQGIGKVPLCFSCTYPELTK